VTATSVSSVALVVLSLCGAYVELRAEVCSQSIAIARTPSGPSVVRAASVGKLVASILAAVREECRACRPVRPFAVLRW
jgi:hypothetical protein